jgi:hypothetical protein
MASRDKAETYEKGEAQSRFEAALRGARIAGHKPMSEIVGKSAKRTLGKVVTKQSKAKARKPGS